VLHSNKFVGMIDLEANLSVNVERYCPENSSRTRCNSSLAAVDARHIRCPV
jgi:hypothetical protein